VITQLHNEALRVCDRFEILVIDDASTDQTSQIVSELQRQLPSVRLLSHPFNIGFSSGIRSGLKHSSYPWLMNIPSDGSFDVADLGKYIAVMDECDLVVGFRPLKERSLGSKIGILITRLILRFFFGVSVRETNSVKLIRKSILDDTIIESRGLAIGSEIIIKSLFKGARMKQIPLSPSKIPERRTDSRKLINGMVMSLELLLFFVMKTFRLADFDPTGEDKKRVLR